MIEKDNLHKSKKELRSYAKELRSSFDMQKISKEIITNFLNNFQINKNNAKIALYYPFNNEPDTTILLGHEEFDFYLPKTDENFIMNFYSYKKGEELITNKYGIKEPKISNTPVFEFDAIIVPALMADKNFYRLGYGGGYYDRFLKKYPNPSYILIPEALIINNLPTDENDVSCDFIVTEKNFYNKS